MFKFLNIYRIAFSAATINMADYIPNQNIYDIQWDSFTSAVDIMMYYIGMSNHTQAQTAGTCRDYIVRKQLILVRPVLTNDFFKLASIVDFGIYCIRGLVKNN